jgi:hypothetical protein
VRPKQFSEPMVRLAQSMHLSCIDPNNVAKWTETRFNMIHVIEDFHRVRPKWFLSLGYVWCKKPCTYLALRLALSPRGPKQASTRASSHRSTIRCVQMIPEPMVHLVQTAYLSYTNSNIIFKWTETRFHMTHVTYEDHRVRPKRFLSLGANRAPILH